MNKNIFIYILSVSIFCFSFNSFSQDTEEHNVNKHSEFKRFSVAVNIGHGYLKTIQENDNGLNVLPTYGLEVEYWINKKWAVGFKGDIEIATYIIEKRENEVEIERERPLILTTPVFFKPWETNGFIFMLGPGIEIEKEENFFVVRMGVAYDVHLSHNWYVAPELIYDIKGGFINSFTAAIGFGKRF